MTDAVLSQLMDTLSDGLFMVDTEGRICEVNASLCLLTGYARDELIGQSCSLLGCDSCSSVRLENARHWCTLFEQHLSMRRRCHIRHKDGTRIPVLKNARLMAKSNVDHGDGSGGVFSVETVTDIREVIERDADILKIRRILYGGSLPGMVGQSSCMNALFRQVEQSAQSEAPVFIHGESGTGKDLVAQALHQLGPRASAPFVGVNCAALNRDVLESELFGHVHGAFTGAVRDRMGRFEAASGGTLFLDEVGDMPLEVQVKLLRVLETGQIERVGEHRSRSVDVRIVSATHRDLDECIRKGTFRQDLAYRIRVIPLDLPPLRQRREDIPLLAMHFLATLRAAGKGDKVFAPDVLPRLAQHDWPGNVRELRNVITYAVAMSPDRVIGIEHLPQLAVDPVPVREDMVSSHAERSSAVASTDPSPAGAAPGRSGHCLEQEAQKKEILTALAACGHNVSKAARQLGIHRTTLINRMLRLGLRVEKACRS